MSEVNFLEIFSPRLPQQLNNNNNNVNNNTNNNTNNTSSNVTSNVDTQKNHIPETNIKKMNNFHEKVNHDSPRDSPSVSPLSSEKVPKV
jgi:hypothetical protein